MREEKFSHCINSVSSFRALTYGVSPLPWKKNWRGNHRLSARSVSFVAPPYWCSIGCVRIICRDDVMMSPSQEEKDCLLASFFLTAIAPSVAVQGEMPSGEFHPPKWEGDRFRLLNWSMWWSGRKIANVSNDKLFLIDLKKRIWH